MQVNVMRLDVLWRIVRFMYIATVVIVAVAVAADAAVAVALLTQGRCG